MVFQNDNGEKKWYVVYTMPKAEKRVKKKLEEKNLRTFLPLYQKVVQRSDRKKKLWTPLFPGYIFINLGIKEIYQVYGTPGVLKFISTKGKKDTVPEKEIETIKLLLRGQPEVYNTQFVIGQNIKVKRGPFSGIRGELIDYKGKSKLIVLLKSIKQSLVVEVSPNHVLRNP